VASAVEQERALGTWAQPPSGIEMRSHAAGNTKPAARADKREKAGGRWIACAKCSCRADRTAGPQLGRIPNATSPNGFPSLGGHYVKISRLASFSKWKAIKLRIVTGGLTEGGGASAGLVEAWKLG